MQMKNLLVFLFGLLMSSAIWAQQKTISGTVSDASGPLPGANVIVKGTTIGVVTSPDGTFVLDVPQNTTSLVVSFIGYVLQEVDIAGKTSVDVVLIADAIGLEEVVAIGYGSVKKSDLTGAVGAVQGQAIADRQTTMLSQALQGQTPGVVVTRNNNAPGASATIRIRGITTIGDSNPLIIVDGVPVDNINDINPNDVESMSVLKDAASASIYGSRAAAGVILITTKRAKVGEVSLTYNMEYGYETPTKLPEFVDVKRYMQLANELRWNDKNNDANEYPLYTKDVVDNYDELNAQNPNTYPNTNWVDLILEDKAPRQSHVLSITAGTKAVRTNASLAYDKTEGLFYNKSYERISARLNNDITINKRLSANIDFNFKRSNSEAPYHDPIANMFISPAVYAAQWADGRVAEGKTGANAWGMMRFGGYRNAWYNTVGGKIALNYSPLEGLTLSAIVSPSLDFDKYKNFQLKNPYYTADDPTVLGGYLEGGQSTNLYENRNDNYRVTSQALANYTKSFGNHNLNVMAGYENFYAFNENLGASRLQYELTSFPYLNQGPLDFRDNSGNAWENAYRSYFGRVLYNFQNKYFLQGNIRYDGSSRFAEEYRWGSFPSFSAGWVISEESFMQDVAAISFLKLRASWGSLGNERIGNYPYQPTIAFSNALFFQGSNVAAAQTAAQIQYAIRDISWETTESIDIGLDANFFDNRLRFTGDYYKKTTKDMLLALEIPDYIGFDNPDQNTGKMNTKGWEIEIGWNDKIGELGYSVSANLSDYKSVMGDLGGTEFIGDQIKKEGSEFNEWYGYVSDGLFQTAEDLANSPKIISSNKVGDVKYKDISGPDGVPDGIINSTYDRVLLGGSLPRYVYGGNLKLSFKNFDLSMVVQGVGKVQTRLGNLMVQPLYANWGNVPKILDGTSWSKYNTDEQNLAAKYPRLTENNKGANYAMSDYWLINGAYFRMKNITLGYNVPAKLVNKLNLQQVRVYASASDIFSIDQFPKGWDPEVAESGYPITA
ncbi:MAG: TonB-dependent receptor, partial [Bacteroidetes bacterium]